MDNKQQYGNVIIADGDDSDVSYEYAPSEPAVDDNKYNDGLDDVDDEVIFVDTSNMEETSAREQRGARAPQEDPVKSYAIVPQSETKDVGSCFQKSIATQEKKEDDSSVSFGDKVAQTIGNLQYAPTAPSFEEAFTQEEKKDYENWLRCTQLSERRQFARHKEWEAGLKQAGAHPEFDACLQDDDLPADALSMAFKGRVAACLDEEMKGSTEEHSTIIRGIAADPSFSNYGVYVPRTFQHSLLHDDEQDSGDEDDGDGDNEQQDFKDGNPTQWEQSHSPHYDEVGLMLRASDSLYKTSWRNPMKNVVPDRKLWVVSDHEGASSGKKLEMWGPGCKKSFRALPGKGKKKGKVLELDINTEYAHVPGRFSIVLVRPNELGFALNLTSHRVRLMLPGRYFVQEYYDNYIGKADVTLGEATEVGAHPSCHDQSIMEWAKRFQVVTVAMGHIAFCMAGGGVFTAAYRGSTPWIIDRANDEAFIAMASVADRVVECECHFLPSKPRYFIVNLQPDEYVVFKDQRSNTIVYRYDAARPALNRLHLPSLLFNFDGRVHKITDETQQLDDVIIVKNNPQDFCVLQDPRGHVRFFDHFTDDITVLRFPWRLLERAQAKSVGNYSFNGNREGRNVSRIVLTPAEWAVVQTRAGEIKIFPPMLTDGVPYYFYQPFHSVHGIVNRFAKEAQHFQMGAYKVTVVNLSTGELGSCRIQNVNMFLNPRPLNPYVFVSPDEFLGKAPVDESHFQAGDLHYVRLNADERACVIRDGEAILLPTSDNELAKENRGNGVYIFRALQHLEVKGPHKKSEAQYDLGPWQFFNVPPGHVGYGTKQGQLHVWGEGQHSANVSNNEQFSGFFQTNVDPVVAKKVEVMCKHAITSKLTITVTYMISDALKTIRCFGGDHPKLHRFVHSLAVSKILELCAKRPPMGFSEADFDPRQVHTDMESISDDLKIITDQSKVSGELLTRLREHPEVSRAGIHIGFAEIQEWKIDEAFMKSSKDIAMRLQAIHAITERKRMELEQQKIDNSRKIDEEKCAIAEAKLRLEQGEVKAQASKRNAIIAAEAKCAVVLAQKEATLKQKVLECECDKELAKQVQEKELIVLEQEQQRAESLKQQAVIQAQKEAATQQAQANADAACAIAHKEAQLKQQELAAETAKQVAIKKQEQQEIENKMNIAQAKAEAMMKSVAMTAERMAQAKAEQEAAELELAAAQTMLEAAKVKAQAELEMMKARAQGEQLLNEAKVSSKFPGLSPQERAQCLLSEQMMETHREISKRTQQVYHTMDPQESQRVYEQQMRNMMAMSRSMAGHMGGGAMKGNLNGNNLNMASMGLFASLARDDPFYETPRTSAPVVGASNAYLEQLTAMLANEKKLSSAPNARPTVNGNGGPHP